jgi:FkbM family methyltransferase
MDNTNYTPKMTMAVAEAGLLADEPFALVDVGCSQGIDSVWRSFGSDIRAFGFDPDIVECNRLQGLETNPLIRYYPMAVGLPEDSDFLRAKAAYEAVHPPYWLSLWERSSVRDPRFTPALRVAGHGTPAEITVTAKIGVTEFLEQQGVGSVDFVKVDTDGSDLEVLLSAEKSIESRQILGFMVECPFQGSDHETSNTFHNIDRLMKRHGFKVYSMTVNKYSRTALPAPFVYSFPAQTAWGQALWGDVVFLRDLYVPPPPAAKFSVEKLIKLACLYEIFCVPDCAAELILQCRERIAARVDPGALLDLVTPPLYGQDVNYREYMDAVAANPTKLFPGK